MNLAQARAAALTIRAALAPACLRCEIAGSIRRQKPDGIKDIEICAIPKPARAVFGQPPDSPLHLLTDDLLEKGIMRKRLGKDGRGAWGLKYRRALWSFSFIANELIPFDLFIAERGNFGALLALRTGPDDFSHRLVTPRRFGGGMPDGMRLEGMWLWRIEERLDTPEESDFFAALALPWLSPELRTEKRLIEILEAQRVKT